MFDIFTKPEGEETILGKIGAIVIGLIIGSGIYAIFGFLNSNVSEGNETSPTFAIFISVVVAIITIYELRRRFAKKTDKTNEDSND